MESPPLAEAETLLFRPSKKRKIYRQRALDEEEVTGVPPSVPPPDAQSLDELIEGASAVNGDEVEAVPISVAEILRLRKVRSKRAGGVEFRAEHGSAAREEERALVLRIEQESDGDGNKHLKGVRKFAPQMGAVGDVNKHMMEYIDYELAKRRCAEEGTRVSSSLHSLGTGTGSSPTVPPGELKPPKTDIAKPAAALGKLVEVDLGEEARQRNEERTKRRLRGEQIDDEIVKKNPKVRLGRDGKPWRGRKRRNSGDIRRDQLVEDVLRESRLEHYEEPLETTPDLNDGQAADDRIAEAFKQEFMDAVSQRRQKKTAPPASTSRAGKEEEPKGPKLGGSRNARAAMREAMSKQKLEKKK